MRKFIVRLFRRKPQLAIVGPKPVISRATAAKLLAAHMAQAANRGALQ